MESEFTELDAVFMRKALKLAQKGSGRTSPNPMVGAVIVSDGKVVSQGYHHYLGAPHAEADALSKAVSSGTDLTGATLYVNLEPCCHYGRTPPCVHIIIESGIKRVVAAMKDPNPLVGGKGFDILRNSGISVNCGLLEKEARKLNEAYVKFITTSMPFVTVKAAISLDGKTSTAAGDSRWISSPQSLKRSRRARSFVDAIVAGKTTVLKDNPLLTARNEKKTLTAQPLAVILDSRLEIPPDYKIFTTTERRKVFVYCSLDAPKEKVKRLQNEGIDVIPVPDCPYSGKPPARSPSSRSGLDLHAVMRDLGQKQTASVLVEGGPTLHFSFFESRLADKIEFYIAPMIIGGVKAPTAVDGKGFSAIGDTIGIEDMQVRRLGNDLFIQGYPVYPESDK